MQVDPRGLGYNIRPAVASDMNFMRKNWQESHVGWLLPRGLTSERAARKKRLYDGMNRLLTTRNTLVACDTDDPNHLFGFACGQQDPAVLHYVFIKPIYRRNGLARSLVAAACGPTSAIVCTHWGWGLPRDDKDTLMVDGVRLVYVGTMEPPSKYRRVAPSGRMDELYGPAA